MTPQRASTDLSRHANLWKNKSRGSVICTMEPGTNQHELLKSSTRLWQIRTRASEGSSVDRIPIYYDKKEALS